MYVMETFLRLSTIAYQNLVLMGHNIIRRRHDILIQISNFTKIVVSPADGLIIGSLANATIRICWTCPLITMDFE